MLFYGDFVGLGCRGCVLLSFFIWFAVVQCFSYEIASVWLCVTRFRFVVFFWAAHGRCGSVLNGVVWCMWFGICVVYEFSSVCGDIVGVEYGGAACFVR